MTKREKKRKFFFYASCEYKIDFNRILHLWDNDEDDKYSALKNWMNSERKTRNAILKAFHNNLEEAISILNENDNIAMKEFFYKYRFRIIPSFDVQSKALDLFKDEEF
jgi:hypothetical protein